MLLPKRKKKEKKEKKRIVAIEFPKIGERERENYLDKKYILDSYSKKYTFLFFLFVNSFFFTEAVWFVCMLCSFISYCKSILCMIYPMKQIMNLVSSTLILILKKKKKKYIDSYSTK